ncbi:hypothetical protein DRP05_12770 [Archaeoglobales archaeon]|nr:MAG: hypothetical protein DRP05_12770 [Archaeoglobales archaeon]
MPDYIKIHTLVEEFRRDLMKQLEEFEMETVREVEKRVEKRATQEYRSNIKSITKLAMLRKDNVENFIRLVKAIEAIENRKGEIDSSFKQDLKSRLGFNDWQVEALIDFVQIGRAYEQLKLNKEKVLEHLEV